MSASRDALSSHPRLGDRGTGRFSPAGEAARPRECILGSVEPTRSGTPTLRVNGKYFHSRYDPLKEAERAAEVAAGASVVFLLSPGLGYTADYLGGERCVSIERHPEIREAANRDYLVNPSRDDLFDLVRDLPGLHEGKVSILSGTFLDEDREYYETLKKAILEAVGKRAEELLTAGAFEELWERNLRANAFHFPRARWIHELDGTLAARTAVVLAAGPSLEEVLPLLEERLGDRDERERLGVSLLAVDSALPATLAAGLRPDFAVTVDPQPRKALALRDLGEIPLVASVLSPPESLGVAHHVFFFGQGHPGEAALGVRPASVMGDVGGSVATAAAALSIRWGAVRVVLAGQDLGFPDFRTHARGTPDHMKAVEETGRFRSLEGARNAPARPTVFRSVRAVDGRRIPTSAALDSYRLYFERLARDYPRIQFLNTSRAGAAVEGFRAMKMAEFLEKLAGESDERGVTE